MCKCAPVWTMVKLCEQGTEWGLWKSETQKERLLTLLGAAYFLHTKGQGGHIRPRSHSASKWNVLLFICLGTVCTEWATNHFSWSYCRYLQMAGPKMQEKLSVEIISDKIQKSVLAIMMKILILGQIWDECQIAQCHFFHKGAYFLQCAPKVTPHMSRKVS